MNTRPPGYEPGEIRAAFYGCPARLLYPAEPPSEVESDLLAYETSVLPSTLQGHELARGSKVGARPAGGYHHRQLERRSWRFHDFLELSVMEHVTGVEPA